MKGGSRELRSRAYLTNTRIQRGIRAWARRAGRLWSWDERGVTIGDYLVPYWHFWHHLKNQKDFFFFIVLARFRSV